HGGGPFLLLQDAPDVSYIVDDIEFEDAGLYKCQVADDIAIAESQSVELSVLPGVPVAGPFALVVLLALCAVAALLVLRRQGAPSRTTLGCEELSKR
ncbi:MAG: hypothetical protein KA184_22770, partial [Candidatus Hydrogenedentes bacterium]|nr:hypothetical protein [Candidatus Hydrogenedentota bacterium]